MTTHYKLTQTSIFRLQEIPQEITVVIYILRQYKTHTSLYLREFDNIFPFKRNSNKFYNIGICMVA